MKPFHFLLNLSTHTMYAILHCLKIHKIILNLFSHITFFYKSSINAYILLGPKLHLTSKILLSNAIGYIRISPLKLYDILNEKK